MSPGDPQRRRRAQQSQSSRRAGPNPPRQRPSGSKSSGSGGASPANKSGSRPNSRAPGSRKTGSKSSADRRYNRSRSDLGGEQIEGRHAVRELLLAGRRRTRTVLVARGQDKAPIIDDIVELAREQRATLREVSRPELDATARTESPQGVIALADPLSDEGLIDLISRPAAGDGRARVPADDPPFLLALDGITDPGNFGAVLRAAECAGVTGIVVPRHRAAHVTPTVAKAAAGAVEHLRFATVPGLPAALRTLQQHQVWTVGLDAAGTVPVYDLEMSGEAVALVIGAEGRGLSRLVAQRCDVLASIPLKGALSSLNVATAAAVACFEMARRR